MNPTEPYYTIGFSEGEARSLKDHLRDELPGHQERLDDLLDQIDALKREHEARCAEYNRLFTVYDRLCMRLGVMS